MNPKYNYILLIVSSQNILFYIIPEESKKEIITKPRFIFPNKEGGNSIAIFNPNNTHIIASSFDKTIQIWSVRKPSIHKINCTKNITTMKWHQNGSLLGVIAGNNIIKIYDYRNKKQIFNLRLEQYDIDFEFIEKSCILISNSDHKEILLYKFQTISNSFTYKKIFKFDYKFILIGNTYALLYSNNNIYLFEDNEDSIIIKPIQKFEYSLCRPKILEGQKSILPLKIIDINSENVIKLISIGNPSMEAHLKNKNQNQKDVGPKSEEKEETEYVPDDIEEENLKEDYFKDCPEIFMQIVECLDFSKNIVENEDTIKKQYFKIPEIQQIFNDRKNKNLILLRNEVEEGLNKKLIFENKENKSNQEIKEEYLFLIKLLIKDETNAKLLEKYLSFLQKNEKKLEELKIPYEKFDDELKYYSMFFEKEYLKSKFNRELTSEKDKLTKLIEDYSDNIEKKTLEEFMNEAEKKYSIIHFNQPIYFNLEELIYFDCTRILLSDIFDSEERKEQNLNNKLYLLNKIKENKLIDKFNEADILVPLMTFICHAEEKENCEFFLNLINSKTLSDNELEEIKSYGGKIYTYENEKILSFEDNFYKNPNELCLKNLMSKNYHQCEKYNFKYLIKNPPLKINISLIKEYLMFVLKSKVFKDAITKLTGINANENILNNDMIDKFISDIKFLPTNFSKINGFFDNFSLITFIPTTKKEINTNDAPIKEKYCIILEKGVLIVIIYHEFSHYINAVISFTEGKLKSSNIPRKEYLSFREVGYYLELLLFGKVIKTLSLEEAEYILNSDNYYKSLEDFRKGFKKVSDNEKNESKNEEMNKKNIYYTIKAKEGEDDFKSYLNQTKIHIPLRNDIIGRKINEEDLESYLI